MAREIFTITRRRATGRWELALGPDASQKDHRQFSKRLRVAKSHPEFDRIYRLAPTFRMKLDAPKGQALPKPSKPAPKAVPAPAAQAKATNASEAKSEAQAPAPAKPVKPGSSRLSKLIKKANQ